METAKIKEYLLKYNTLRRIVQFITFIVLGAVFLNMGVIPLLLPILWTWGLSQNMVGDAFTAVQFGLYSAVFPWLAVASFLIIGVLLGKAMCSWICPFGLVQDLLTYVRRKKSDFSPRTHGSLIYVKYFILGLTLFIGVTFSATKIMGISTTYEKAMGIFAKAPFTTLSPGETLFVSLPSMIKGFRFAVAETSLNDAIAGFTTLPALFLVQFGMMVAILVFATYIERGWCKYFCPHGAIMALLNRFSFLGLRRDPVKCAKSGCRSCVEACPMHVPILNEKWEKFSHPECIYCLKCVDACKDKAIKLKYP